MERNIQIENQIKEIIKQYPIHFCKILKRKENQKLLVYINQQTPLLQNFIYNLSTKLNWIINNITQWKICPICKLSFIKKYKNLLKII